MSRRTRDRRPVKLGVRAQVARTLLTREIGQRIPTLQELQASARVGTGTVVKALQSLQEEGAVKLTARGHQGTVVTDRDVAALWHAGELGNLRLLMPPPGPIEQWGIVTAAQDALGKLGVAVVLTYRAGASARLEQVFTEDVDVTVTSAGAFAAAQERFQGLTAINLGAHSFYARSSLVVVSRTPPAGRPRVGIDRLSHDHTALTMAEFADQDVEFVPCVFVNGPAAVLAGKLDMVVWHAMPTVIPPALAGLQVTPVRDDVLSEIADVSTAVLVSRGLDAPVNALLRSVRIADIAATQAALLRRAEDGAVDGSGAWLS